MGWWGLIILVFVMKWNVKMAASYFDVVFCWIWVLCRKCLPSGWLIEPETCECVLCPFPSEDGGSEAGTQSAAELPGRSRGLRAEQASSHTGGWSRLWLGPLKPHHTCCLTRVSSPLCLMQRAKAGWFSGWFKSKAKDQSESVGEGSPAQTVRVQSTCIVFLDDRTFNLVT